MRKLILVVSLLPIVSCRSTTPPPVAIEPAEVYAQAVLANQECYRRFDRIDRQETITIINRDREGNITKRPRTEVDRDIVALANSHEDRSGLLGVTVHPFLTIRIRSL